jgi:hypothetical protein
MGGRTDRNNGRSQSNILWNTEKSINVSESLLISVLYKYFYIQIQDIHNYWLKFVVMKITFFCDVMPSSVQDFTYILEEPVASIYRVPTMKMEIVGISKTLFNVYHTRSHHKPENSDHFTHCHENLISWSL